ncbi:g7735 [Coccomyxa viridis]|uniref:H/ACA ribonucleoprotein complex subunit 2 n=1 Tax=Coccomyxa viridis TaxID=1274662 RepID=A0ABP1FYL2_9CHLO
MVKADKPKKEKRAAEAAADGPEKKIKKSKKEKKELPEEEADTALNGTAEPTADVAMEEPVSEKKKKKKRKSEADEAAEAAPSEPPSTGKKKKKKADAEQTAAVPIAEAPVEGTVIVTAEDEDVEEAENDEDAVPKEVVKKTGPFLIPIADPLADEKMTKKVLKLAKKASKRKQTKRGTKEVVKGIRKGLKGICILAGDISPIDVITHIPVLCEENQIPYIYVPSKEALGAAGLTKRPTSILMVLPKPLKGAVDDNEAKEFAESYEAVRAKIASIEPLYMRR